jgi:hypothetical protein
MRRLLGLVAIGLAGCAGNQGDRIYPIGLSGQNVSGNAAYVSISNVWNEQDALPIAERHCARFGKLARFNRMQGYRAVFDCVKDS